MIAAALEAVLNLRRPREDFDNEPSEELGREMALGQSD